MSGVEVDEEELQLEISKLKQVLASAAPPPQPDYYEIDTYGQDSAAPTQASITYSDPRQQQLHANLSFQNVLRAQLRAIEAAQAHNLNLQKRMRTLITTTTKPAKPSKVARPPSLAASMLFPDDPKAEEALENDDVKKKRARQQMVPLHHKFKRWAKQELDGLKKGVRQQNQQLLLDKLMSEYQSENKDLEVFNKEVEAISALPEEELEKNVVGIDWEQLAKAYVPTRTANDCRINWMNTLSPQINEAREWAKPEDKQLLTLVKEHKAFDWQRIAQDLGTNRSAWLCFRRYQRSLNNTMTKSKWTPEEDELLRKAVKECGDKNWQQVALHLDNRTGQQCLHRWQKTLNPSIRRGRWNHEEDKRLILAYKAYEGRSWILVQPHLQGRTDVQCRERWCNVLDPSISSGSWTAEEDAKLRLATEEFGLGKWASVAQRVGTRTDNQCWRRWKVLNQDAVLPYRQSVYKKKVVSNAGRDKELTADDFEEEEVPPLAKKRGPRAVAPAPAPPPAAAAIVGSTPVPVSGLYAAEELSLVVPTRTAAIGRSARTKRKKVTDE